MVITAASGLAAFTLPALGQQEASTTTGTESSTGLNHKTEAFVKQAARDNDEEISMAKLGETKAQNANLKSLCQMIERDHTQANQQLQPIAQKYNVSIQESPTHHFSRGLSKLDKESSGPKFDQTLATDFLRDHQQDLVKFQKAATEIQAPDVKQYIDSSLPVLRKHFERAQTVAQEVGVPQSTISDIVNRAPAAMGGAETMQQQETGIGTGLGNPKGAGAKALQQDKVGPSSQPRQ